MAVARSMPSRRSRRRTGSTRFTIGLLVLASITLITLDYRGDTHGVIAGLQRGAHDAFAPVQRGVDAVTRPIGSFFAGAVHGSALQQQNSRLEQELDQLRSSALTNQAMVNELHTLKALDHLPWTPGIPTIAAEVVALAPSNFESTVQLDVGSARGVQVDMPVVGGSGLVGRVIRTWSSGCTVLLIDDLSSAVSVRFGPPGTDALVRGSGSGRPLTVSFVSPELTLHKGEPLVTSGLQHALFPPDIPVARVSSYSSTPSATAATVTAAPVVDLGDLQFVDVLMWQPSL